MSLRFDHEIEGNSDRLGFQVELAKKLKRSQTFVARMESGRRRIDVVEFLDLAEVIGFSPSKLIEALLQPACTPGFLAKSI